MNQPVNTRSYDILKAIVALILLIILIWLLLSGTPRTATPLAKTPTAGTDISLQQAEPTSPTQPAQPSPTPTLEPTEPPAPTQTPAPTQMPPTAIPTASPEPTAAPTAAETPTATPGPVIVDCPLALPTRLKVGDTARVTSNLNMRVDASITSALILTNPTGSELTIIDGPVCQPYQSGAYIWWQVRRPDDQSGWSAEASLLDKFYFLEPID